MLVAVGVVFACVLAAPGFASAESFFEVDSAADEVDASPGDAVCLTADGKCTLRAAIEESNLSAETRDSVSFKEEVFEEPGDPAIQLDNSLPPIIDPLSLAGRQCETGAGVPGPCVEIDGPAGGPALTVEDIVVGKEGPRVEIESLAITGSEVGIEAERVDSLHIRSSWFGIGIDGSEAGNSTGVRLGPGSEGTRIGGEGSEAGNLFGYNDIGLDILGASRSRILGNDFGITPAGTQAATNEVNLAISSSEDSVALDNIVGTRINPADAATPACDGGCNLIAGGGSSGIDLTGSSGSAPPIGTTIVGNHIGLDAAGTASLPNVGAGVLVGNAPHTTIGGPRPGDENRIAGGTAAVEAGPETPNLVVRRNLIGSRVNATAEPPQEGLIIDSGDLSLPAEEALILGNEIGLDGGAGISHAGLGAEISGNLVEGAATGIEVQDEGSENLIDSNLVKVTGVGILVKGPFNTIVGNAIAGGQKTGIRIEGTGLFGVSGNVIGGETAAAENTIDGSTGAAIEIANPKKSRNEVARNRGSGNAGLFIRLIAVSDPDDPDPGEPNGGILPPPIAVISEAGAAGFAEPGATVRVFRKATPAPGEIASFLGQATADEEGNWTLTFPAPLPVGTAIAATQTLEGGTSELEIATVPPPNEGQRPPAAEAPLDRRPPRTKMLRQPRRVPKDGVARFAFTSNEAASRFQCSLDGGKFRACKSPRRYRNLRPGRHVFRVRAIDAAGNVDRTPVKRRFEVLD